jgi:hypothetical protein
MESIYQALPASAPAPANSQRPDLSQADRLLLAAVVAIPRALRYGAITWIQDGFGVGRQTVHDNAARDETYFGDKPMRLSVDPHRLVIQRGQVLETVALDDQLPAWRIDNLGHFGDPERAKLFEGVVARAWRLQPALTNGHHRLARRPGSSGRRLGLLPASLTPQAGAPAPARFTLGQCRRITQHSQPPTAPGDTLSESCRRW